jgi:hypothetical protein
VNLKAAPADRTRTAGAVGPGRAGPPLALPFARAGLPVVGVDLDPAPVRRLDEQVAEAALTGLDWRGASTSRPPVPAAGPVRARGSRAPVQVLRAGPVPANGSRAPVQVLRGESLDRDQLRAADRRLPAPGHRQHDRRRIASQARLVVDPRNAVRGLDDSSTGARIVRP